MLATATTMQLAAIHRRSLRITTAMVDASLSQITITPNAIDIPSMARDAHDTRESSNRSVR
jgi:hypothetical protein